MTAGYDYHGALVIALSPAGEILFIHPPGAPAEAPASLPSNPCHPGEDPADGAVRIANQRALRAYLEQGR